MKKAKINIITKNNKMKHFISLFLIITLFTKCNSQKVDYINRKFKIDLLSYNEKDGSFKSKKLDSLFNYHNAKYFIPDISGTQTDNYYIKVININYKKIYLLIYDNNNFLRDTLLIPSDNVFSINAKLENNKNAICLGKFDKKNSFFEIHEIYELSKNLKLKKVKDNTNIIHCPLPLEYLSEENVGIENYYKYGKLNNKTIKALDSGKMSQKWLGTYSAYFSYGEIGGLNVGWALTIEINSDSIKATGDGYQMGFIDLLTAKENKNELILNHLKNLYGYTLGVDMNPEFILIEKNGKYFIKSDWIDYDIKTKPKKLGYEIEKIK